MITVEQLAMTLVAGFVSGATVAVVQFLLLRLSERREEEASYGGSDRTEDAVDDPEKNHDAMKRAALIVDHELAASTIGKGTIGDRQWFGENVVAALAEKGLIRGAGWLPPERNFDRSKIDAASG